MVEPQLEGVRSTGRISALIRFLRLLLQSVALGLGAWLAIEKQISGGAIFASSMLAARALSPIDMIVANWRLLSAGVTSYLSVRGQLRYEPPQERTHLPAPKARLSLRQLSVLPPSRERPQPLIDAVGFEASAGQVVGVVGPSGSGKTTLLQVIAGARIPDRGEARLDGARYADWDPERLGRFIGYLPQDSALFPGSIKDNISRFERWTDVDPALIDHKTLAAARAAEIHELILTLPQGYETVLGPRGRGLSAGQQQRVALARAAYGEPFLYVLDEPNSNADAEGEIALVRLIARLKAEGAIVVMSVHRASLMGVVDILAQLRGGRLERLGPRDQVLASLQAPAGPPAGRPAVDKVL
jgi:ATP-binding cassette subfamily C protein